jgi:hypothetical protein
MTDSRLGPLTPLPSDYLYPGKDDASEKLRKEYDALPDDTARLNKGGKWWNMYDLMKYFHSGIMPELSDVNYINYEIDFTAPELKRAASADPALANEVNSSMTPGLQALSSKIQTLISQQQLAASKAALETTTSAITRPRSGGKRKGKTGGANPPGAAAAADAGVPPGVISPPAAVIAAPPAAGVAPAAAPVAPVQETVDSLISVANLEAECLRDLFRVKLNSNNRIFITDASKKVPLPFKTALNLPDPTKLFLANESTAGGGGRGRGKTRKTHKKGKKNKTKHRHYYRRK